MEPRRIAETLQAHGVRATQQRVAVYEYLLLHPIHPTADMIFTALLPRYPTFSRTTISVSYTHLDVYKRQVLSLTKPLLQ